MDEHHRRMTPAEKGEVLRRAWRTARVLQLAGLRERYPQESEAQLELRLAENWIGKTLFDRVQAWRAMHGHE